MTDLAVFPDIEIVVRAVLLDLCPNIAGDTPPDPDGTLSWLPFVQVACIGGPSDRVTDESLLSVQCYASTRGAASLLARQVQQRLTSGPLVVPGKGTVDVGVTRSKPQYVQYTTVLPNQPGYIARFAATYSLDQRRTS